jgi:hypothetical protein
MFHTMISRPAIETVTRISRVYFIVALEGGGVRVLR